MCRAGAACRVAGRQSMGLRQQDPRGSLQPRVQTTGMRVLGAPREVSGFELGASSCESVSQKVAFHPRPPSSPLDTESQRPKLRGLGCTRIQVNWFL